MKTKGVRMHGKDDVRFEEFGLPDMTENDIVCKVICDSICMSTYKAIKQGTAHRAIPDDIAENPSIMGHEFCCEIYKVGKKWQGKYHEGDKCLIKLGLDGKSNVAGYGCTFCGGNSQFIYIPDSVIEADCIIPYDKNAAAFYGSVSEPMACIISGYHSCFHSEYGVYHHEMGTKKGGNLALLASCGPMGFGAIDYALHCDRAPKLLVVTDINDERIARAASIYTVEHAAELGIELHYVNTAKEENGGTDKLMELSGGKGYDDVIVFAPVSAVLEQGHAIMGDNGCMNFFAGPIDHNFSANINFHKVHYRRVNIFGTSGSNDDDMQEALDMSFAGEINPAAMITHVGGLDSAADTLLNYPKIPGGKKMVYAQISMPMTAISDFAELGKNDKLYKELAEICAKHNNLWNKEAEDYLLANAKPI